VSLPSQSRVWVQRLRRIVLTGGVQRLFELEAGRSRITVTPLRSPRDEFKVSTPVAVSTVRGTEFRTHYDEASKRASTEVLHGEVAVQPRQGHPVAVAADFAAFATPDGTSAVYQLLPPPTLLDAGSPQNDDEVHFDIQPDPAAAGGYHVQVAPDAAFIDVIAETYGNQTAHFPELADGTWFVRVSAIDANGLEGRPATYSFERRLNGIAASVESGRSTGRREYLFRWLVTGGGRHQFRLQLMRDRSDGPVVVDEIGLTADGVVVTDLPAGNYYWHVMTMQFDGKGPPTTNWSPFEQLTIPVEK
jgi:hypothetical protein